MGASDDFSLFDPSSHKREERPPKQEKPEKKKKKTFQLTPEQKEEQRKKLEERDPELKEIFNKMGDYHKELKDQIFNLLEKEGHTPQSLSRFLNNTSNFSEEQKKLIQKQKEELDKTLGIKLNPSLQKIQKDKKTKKATQKRRGKTLGDRKGWIDMR